MSYGRLIFGSARRVASTPRFRLLLGPISLSCAMPSPLVANDRPEQVEVPGLKSQSDQLRVSLCSASGS